MANTKDARLRTETTGRFEWPPRPEPVPMRFMAAPFIEIEHTPAWTQSLRANARPMPDDPVSARSVCNTPWNLPLHFDACVRPLGTCHHAVDDQDGCHFSRSIGAARL